MKKRPHCLQIVSCVILFCVLLCCKQTNTSLKTRLKAFIGTEIVIPRSLPLFNDVNHHINRDAKYKIICYIDSVSCAECRLNKSVLTWVSLMNSFEKEDFSLFIIVDSQDFNQIRALFERYGLDIPFFIDFNSEFRGANNIPTEELFHTFLLRDNIVVLAGDPSNNPNLQSLYDKEIKRK